MTFDPTKPVRTRDGRNARIVCTDVNNSMPIIALIKDEYGKEWIAHYGIGGNVYGYSQDKSDLVNIPERVERWVNVFPIQYGWSVTNHKTKADADYTGECRVGLVKLVFEDDKLVEVTLEKE